MPGLPLNSVVPYRSRPTVMSNGGPESRITNGLRRTFHFVLNEPFNTARPIGVILAIDPAAKRVTIKTDSGPEMTIVFDEATRFLRVAPGAKDLENAAPISAPELTAGDRILARGRSGGDPGSFVATSIIVISKADLARKHAAERAEWEKRGVGGVISALDPAAKEITINIPITAGAKPMVIAFAPGATLH